MSAFSDLRDARAEHDEVRANFSASQNADMDDGFASGKRWLIVGYGSAALMVVALTIAFM